MIFWGMTAFAVIKAVWAVRQKTSNWYHYQTFTIRFDSGCFYVGVLINHHNTQQIALYFALYLVIGVVFTIARRVLPFFITKGISVNHDGTPNGMQLEQKKLRSTGQAQFIWFFWIHHFDLFIKQPMIAGVCALVCLMANLARLKNWYHHAIWQKPLLWSLIIAFFWHDDKFGDVCTLSDCHTVKLV